MDRKQRILDVALELFAKEGFSATPTSKIAREAGVSEGLIFRHFENKAGLLEALLEELQTKLDHYTEIVKSFEDPKDILRASLQLIFEIPEEEMNFWRLQYALKMDERYSGYRVDSNMELLENAFKALGYKNAKMEAQMFFEIIDATFLHNIRGELQNKEEFRAFLMEKYGL